MLSKKFRISILAALIFFIIANPETFKVMRGVLGEWVASPTGCPTTDGLILHTCVYLLITYLLMRGNRELLEGEEEVVNVKIKDATVSPASNNLANNVSDPMINAAAANANTMMKAAAANANATMNAAAANATINAVAANANMNGVAANANMMNNAAAAKSNMMNAAAANANIMINTAAANANMMNASAANANMMNGPVQQPINSSSNKMSSITGADLNGNSSFSSVDETSSAMINAAQPLNTVAPSAPVDMTRMLSGSSWNKCACEDGGEVLVLK